jgi:hypothetical protein
MKWKSLSLAFFSVLLSISVIVTSGCVKVKTNEVTPPAPAGNQPPVISSLTAATNQTTPGGEVNIQSVVTDPNKDAINFLWTSSGGSFVEQGRGNTTWRAPNQMGDYEIKLKVDDGKGASAESTLNIKVSTNHPPAISSLTANPASVQFAVPVTLTCIASDQDGDALTYTWSAREGSLTGTGNKVTWVSPSKNGSFSVVIAVTDSKGAESKQELVIPVASVSNVQTINVVAKESGTVDSTGDKNTGVYKAGDDDKNIGYRAFFSFNIFPLWGMEVKQARIKFIGTKMVGEPHDPTTGVGGFQIRHLIYGSTIPKFGLMEGGPIQREPTYLNNGVMIEEVDVTPELINDVSNRLERAQFEAAFMKKTSNGNNIAEFVQWQDFVLEVTAAPK